MKMHKTMAFSLPQDLELRLQKVVKRAQIDRLLADHLGLTPPVESIPMDAHGFTPDDYAVLQGIVLRRDLTGPDLVSYALLPSTTVTTYMRQRVRRLIRETRARNRRVRKTAVINLSRVVSALIKLGLESLPPAQEIVDAPVKSGRRKGRHARQAA
jgi:hypothetical protein